MRAVTIRIRDLWTGSNNECMLQRSKAPWLTLWYKELILQRRIRMNKKEISLIRSQLGKTQKQMAQLLGISIKSIQSFEQGWRKIPVHIERQSLLLLALKRSGDGKRKPCWSVKKCPKAIKESCPAWEFNAGVSAGASTGRSVMAMCRQAGRKR